jgi:hypothetical protein
MADDIYKWIRKVSALNDEQLKQEIDLVHQSSIKAFARALAKVRTLLIQSICFCQLVNKPSLQSTPMYNKAFQLEIRHVSFVHCVLSISE